MQTYVCRDECMERTYVTERKYPTYIQRDIKNIAEIRSKLLKRRKIESRQAEKIPTWDT